MWKITGRDRGLDNVIVMASDPIVTVTVGVMGVPKANKEKFYEELLRLNASELAHGAYGIEGDNVVMVDSLESENLDLNEFQASLDSISLALNQHYKILTKYRDNK
ncbi:MAG: hypothetical protein JW969_06680 [Spirochaetales bacterium]|nr:hypothetical protein [Spirochaetales bacterium]